MPTEDSKAMGTLLEYNQGIKLFWATQNKSAGLSNVTRDPCTASEHFRGMTHPQLDFPELRHSFPVLQIDDS
jgi:hypothetical protein